MVDAQPLFMGADAEAVSECSIEGRQIAVYRRELWTARQRQSSSIHEVSYRACFKPQLPAYFISRLTNAEDTVYDPFSGRGTTAIEAALHGRRVIANDVNPLSEILTRPRLEPPRSMHIAARLASIAAQRRPHLGRRICPCSITTPRCAKSSRCASISGSAAVKAMKTRQTAGYAWSRPIA